MQNAHSYNNRLSTRYLKNLSNINLLRLTHPRDRVDFARQLRKENKLSEYNLKIFIAESKSERSPVYG